MNRRVILIEDDRDDHIARHNVTTEEALEVVYSRAFVRRTYHGSYTIVGQTDSGRYLVVVIAPRRQTGMYGLKTAREATLAERRSFIRWAGRKR